MKRDRGDVEIGVMVFILVLILVGVGFLVKWSIDEQNKWEAWCHDQGGTVDHTTHTNGGYGFDSKGKYVYTTTTDTTYYCMRDGLILDIK